MAKFGGSKMYPRGLAIAYSASNRVGTFALGIDKDFFRTLLRMAVRWGIDRWKRLLIGKMHVDMRRRALLACHCYRDLAGGNACPT